MVIMRSSRCRSRRLQQGFSLVDVLVALLIIGVGLATLFAANSRAMSMLRSAKQAAVASKCLQQRIEQIRNYNWTQVTDAQSMQDLYAVPPLPSIELPGFSEQVIISQYTPALLQNTAAPAPSPPYLQITRANDGTVALVSDNTALVNGPSVRVDVQITWPGAIGATRMRETSVIIANGGIGR
jgi:Tfp pilus assembly protein PilE